MANASPVADLPPARLPVEPIPADTLNRIPKQLALEFGAVFFAESPTELSLGILHPELLKDRVNEALTVLQSQVGKSIKLFLINQTDFDRVIAQYRNQTEAEVPAPTVATTTSEPAPATPAPTPEPQSAPNPPTYTISGDVAENVLSTMPLEYAQGHRLITVDMNTNNEYWVATDKPSDRQRIAVSLIERRNRIHIYLVEVPAAEFERLLTIREAIEDRRENPPEPKTGTGTAAAESKLESVTQVPADRGIFQPGLDGQIITGEVEKSGVAGLLQRASGLFGSGKSEGPSESAPTTDTQSQSTTDQNTAVSGSPKDNEGGAFDREQAESARPNGDAKDERLSVPQQKAVPTIKEVGIAKESDETTLVDDEVAKIFRRPVTNIQQLQIIVRQGSVPRILAGIINFAVEQRASDIHIEPYGDELLIRYRVDGQLGEVMKLPMDIHPAMVSRVKILSKLKLDEQRIPQDGRFDVVVAGDRNIDIRVSTLPTVHGEKVVMRLLDKSEQIYSLEKLGLSGDGLNRLVSAIKQPYGVILATGPTGSGKTTTLYAILQRVVTTKVNVITLEDPVEYEMKGINQSQIKPKIGFTFAEGLRSVLRQDPNIIMVGEVRDAETASMVTHAALTGHLVLSTLHTNNAAGALPRMINMGVEPFLITSAMNAIIAQRLVRKLCPKCRERVELPDTIRREIDKELEDIRKNNPKEAQRIPAKLEFYRPLEGCADCTSGYRGRLGLYEVFAMNDKIEDLAIKKAPALDIEAAAKESGMITMKQDGILKVLEGFTTLDEVLRETSDR